MSCPQRIVKGKRDDDAVYPIDKWLDSIRDKKTRARISQRIDRVARGNFGDRRDVGQGVNELRIDMGPGYRIYYGRVRAMVVILLAGGDKSSQSSDIRNAQALWADMEKEGIDEANLPSWSEETS